MPISRLSLLSTADVMFGVSHEIKTTETFAQIELKIRRVSFSEQNIKFQIMQDKFAKIYETILQFYKTNSQIRKVKFSQSKNFLIIILRRKKRKKIKK